MNILVFSDTHFGKKLQPKRLQQLLDLIEQADKVIINGDFWDGYLIQFEDFLNSGWQALFEPLKQKQAVYVVGNHDRFAELSDGWKRFATQLTQRYDFSLGGREFCCLHGQTIFPALDFRLKIGMPKSWSWWLWRQVTILDGLLSDLGVWLFGRRFFTFTRAQHRIMKRWRRQNLHALQTLLCGHSHYAEADEANGFYNTGVFDHGLTQHLWVTETGVELVQRPRK